MRRCLLLFAICLLGACGDDASTPADAATPADGRTPDAAVPDGGMPVSACLESPTDLPRPPTGQLPCDLLPPGFGAQ